MSTLDAFWEKYKQKNTNESFWNNTGVNNKAYTSFLETQFEKVAQAVGITQKFSERIETLETQLTTAEDRIAHLTKLVKLQQTYAESQDEKINQLQTTYTQELERRLYNLEELLRINLSKKESQQLTESSEQKFINELEKLKSYIDNTGHSLDEKLIFLQKKIQTVAEQFRTDLQSDYKDLSQKIKKVSNSETLETPHEESTDFYRKTRVQLNNFSYRIQSLEDFNYNLDANIQKRNQEVKELGEIVWEGQSVINKLAQDTATRISQSETRIDSLEEFLVTTAKDVSFLRNKLEDTRTPTPAFLNARLKETTSEQPSESSLSPRFPSPEKSNSQKLRRPLSSISVSVKPKKKPKKQKALKKRTQKTK